MFKAVTPAQLADLWSSLFVLLVAARLLGRLARALRQPRVLGELLAGLLLGPSCLGWIYPHGYTELFTGSERDQLISTIGWLGVALLLLLVGAEMSLKPLEKRIRLVVLLAVGAVVLPGISGFGLGMALPESFIGVHASRPLFAGFIGLCIMVSALPVIVKILSDLGLLRTLFGQVTLAVGVIVDLIGWVAFSIFTSLSHGSADAGTTLLYLAGAVLFAIAALTLGSQIHKRWGTGIDGYATRKPRNLVGIVVCILLAMMMLANTVHLESIAGAVLAGVLVGRAGLVPGEVRRRMTPLVDDVLCPIFFATAGLKVDIRAFNHLGWWIVAIIGAAILTKYVGVTLMGRLGHLNWRFSFAFANSLNARGAVEVIIASGGLAVGILSQQSFSAIVIMAMVTSMMAGPLLGVLLPRGRQDGPDLENLTETPVSRSNGRHPSPLGPGTTREPRASVEGT
jgi:Kef-type K+ transport system membrane component KefB